MATFPEEYLLQFVDKDRLVIDESTRNGHPGVTMRA